MTNKYYIPKCFVKGLRKKSKRLETSKKGFFSF